jgi:nitrous oxidase accessory protein NosD
MSFTLRGRLETRLAAALVPIIAACLVTLATHEWWPLQLAALMLGVGLALDVAVYHPLLRYQPAWLAPFLGLVELGVIVLLVRTLGVEAPPAASYGFFAGAWLISQLLVHAALPLARLSYGEDGGELGRAGPRLVTVVLLIGAAAGGVAWASEPPTVRLSTGTHDGPLVLDSAQKLVGEPGAVVDGGIVVTADDVTIRDVAVLADEDGITVDGAEDVVLERVHVRGATLDGINVRRSSVTIRDCVISEPAGDYAQGIDISFGFDLAPSTVRGCTVTGGQEGIVTHFAHVRVVGNRVVGASLRGITVTEMSMADVEGNSVERSLGVGIYCGDYSMCKIEENFVSDTAPDVDSGNRTRLGFAILAHFGATATVEKNRIVRSPGGIASSLRSRILSE